MITGWPSVATPRRISQRAEESKTWGGHGGPPLQFAPTSGAATSETFHFLNSFANASRAFVGGPDEVSRSTTIRAANSSQVLRAFLFTIRLAIDLLHSKWAPGSKYVH